MLKNKRVVITGGGRGIGKTIAREFLKEGAEVLLVARTRLELEATQNELAVLGRVEILAADVSREIDVTRISNKIYGLWGGVDILVNAAAIQGPIGHITDVDVDEWLRAIEVNLFGTFLMIRAVAPFMKNTCYGKIINFAGGGEGAYPNFTAYVSSKGGVVRLTETVAAELKGFNIDINAIAPGAVNTKMLDDVLVAGPIGAGQETYRKSLEQRESGGVPPEKAARLVLFLAGSASDGLSGKVISAIWDDYDKFPEHLKEIMESDIYSWRRIKPKDRGYDW
ncbi:MAG: SDR family oxidoreductase [bacterium]|nr:SDR family oxidoreductase [bacterium]